MTKCCSDKSPKFKDLATQTKQHQILPAAVANPFLLVYTRNAAAQTTRPAPARQLLNKNWLGLGST